MKYIKKYIALILFIILLSAITACKPTVTDTAVTIEGAVDLQMSIFQKDFDWEKDVSVKGGNYNITVDTSQVDFTKVGRYPIEYSVQAGENKITKTVYVDIVIATKLSIAQNDIELLELLLQQNATNDQKTLINSVAELRADNYTVFVETFDLDLDDENIDEYIQNSFIKELSNTEIDLIKQYILMWQQAFDETAIKEEEVIESINQNIKLGRKYSADETAAVPAIMSIITEYQTSKGEEHPDINNAQTEDFEQVLDRTLTADEQNALIIFIEVRTEYNIKRLLANAGSQLGGYFTDDEINAFIATVDILSLFVSSNTFLPNSAEAAESILDTEFSDEVADAYAVVLGIQKQILSPEAVALGEMLLERDVEEEEIDYILDYFIIMNSFNNNHGEEYPSFHDAPLYYIESVIQRNLTSSESESLYYIKAEIALVMVEGELGRELIADEKEAVPVILALMDTYNYNKDNENDPNFEIATDSEIETVIGRDLTVDEQEALVLYRAIINEMND